MSISCYNSIGRMKFLHTFSKLPYSQRWTNMGNFSIRWVGYGLIEICIESHQHMETKAIEQATKEKK